jgi:hypothetical protein
MSSALMDSLNQIDEVAAEGDLDAPSRDPLTPVDPDDAGPEVNLPDGRTLYIPRVHGERIDTLACDLLDINNPARSRFLRLIGPPGTGKSQLGRAIALELWTRRGRKIEKRNGEPFYGFVEISGGPSSDEYLFRYDFPPNKDNPSEIRMIDSAFVTAMREGLTVIIDEPNTIRDLALLSLNSVFDGRLSLYLPALAETVVAQPGFTCLLAYNPGLTSAASDIPEAWYSRFPACLEISTNWAGLVKSGASQQLVSAARAIDQERLRRENGLSWTPQYREVEALTDMIDRVGERLAISLFISSLSERLQTGSINESEAEAACRMLDNAGFARLKVTESSGKPAMNGYPRAVTS